MQIFLKIRGTCIVSFKDVRESVSSAFIGSLEKGKQFVGMSKIGLKLSKEEEQLEKLYANLGRLHYKVNFDEPEELYADMFRAIAGAQTQVKFLQSEIDRVRGFRRCVFCGEETEISGTFCSYCGKEASSE